jgi:methionine sulfoxide reductase heme-binding subunit
MGIVGQQANYRRGARLTLDPDRVRTHLLLGVITGAACALTYVLQPGFWPVLTFTIAFGYLALLFLAVTLLIGPIQLLRRRRNPVNIHSRRDTGIWAGITGCLHVVFGLQNHMGGQILAYFFTPAGGLRLDLLGVSNDLGAAATVILVALAVLSNNWTLRRLRGPRWKFWQRFNYALFLLVLTHTVGYQTVLPREPIMRPLVGLLALSILAAQLWGRSRYRSHAPSASIGSTEVGNDDRLAVE